MNYNFLLFLLLVSNFGFSQHTDNMISNTSRGYTFKAPIPWKYQNLQNGMHLFGHNEIPGILAVMEHDYDNMQLVASTVTSQGIQEAEMRLTLLGSIEQLKQNAILGTFAGYLDGAEVKATVASLFSPHGGGISVFALTTPDKFNTSYEDLVKTIANTVIFKKPIESALVKQWQSFLSGRKLTYYNTNDSVAEKMIYVLYDNGWFVFLDESFYGSKDEYTDHTYWFSSLTTNKNAGQWKIVGNDTNATLQLEYNNGNASTRSLKMKEGSQSQILLNGKRFFTESLK